MGSVCNSRQCGESFSIHCHMKMLKKDFIIVLKLNFLSISYFPRLLSVVCTLHLQINLTYQY